METTTRILFCVLTLILVTGESNLAADAANSTVNSIFDTKNDPISPNTSRNLANLPPHAPDELLVRFRNVTSPVTRAAAHNRHGASVKRRFRHVDGLEVVKLPPGVSVETALEGYRSSPDVLYAEPNYLVKALDVPNDPLFSSQWSLFNTGQNGGTPGADIKAVQAWDITTGSRDVVVAVIDSGVYYNHPDLAANMWRNEADCNNNGIDDDGDGYVDDCYGIDADYNSGNPYDVLGHGTHVTGIIGALGNNALGVTGVNWNISIMPCRFINSFGWGRISDAIQCLEYVAMMKDRGVNIVATNNSWGGSTFSQALYDAIDSHRQRGILFIASAGNESEDNGVALTLPANTYLPNVVSVAASDQFDQLAGYSNYGKTTVHIDAPGSQVLSTNFNDVVPYFVMSGTSMAAPHVTGVAALLKARDPTLDWRAIRNLILAGGTSFSPAGFTITGKSLNAYGALTCSDSVVLSRMRPISDSYGFVGQPIHLSVLHINCAVPNGEVDVRIEPEGRVITLRDDGIGPDQTEGDGIYSAEWVPSVVGTFQLIFPGDDIVRIEVLTNNTVWCPTGVPVSTAKDGSIQSIGVSDGQGGGLIAWLGFPVFPGPRYIFAQRLNSNGSALWEIEGVQITTPPSLPDNPRIVPDGTGGAIVLWEDFRNGGQRYLYAQRINSSGQSVWQADGVQVTGYCGYGCTLGQVVTDSVGGVIVAWMQFGNQGTSVWAQRIGADGSQRWGSEGVAAGYGIYPQMVADGHGGAIIAWSGFGFDGSLHAQRLAADGTLIWGPGGVDLLASVATGAYGIGLAIANDGAGGAVLAWSDSRVDWDSPKAYTQKINANGVVEWQSGGVGISATSGAQRNPVITDDGNGGAIIGWEDERDLSRKNIYVQRINSSGTSSWAANGVQTSLMYGQNPTILSDGTGGASIIWNETRWATSGNVADYGIYAQRLDQTGTIVWTSEVRRLTEYDAYLLPKAVGNVAGDVMVFWEQSLWSDGRKTRIFAQRLNADAPSVRLCPPGPVSVTVIKSGNGNGTVTSSPGGLDCGADCYAAFSSPLSVTLSVRPDADSDFTGWSGSGCTGTANCTIYVTGQSAVTATLTLKKFTLTVNKLGTGTGYIYSDSIINCGSRCSAIFNAGTTVKLWAYAYPGFVFTGWSGDRCSGTGYCAINLSADTIISATFDPPAPPVPPPPPPPLVVGISSSGIPAGEVNLPYSLSLQISGGRSPYSVYVSRGSLPPGLSLGSPVILGTPTRAGTYKFTIQVTDQLGSLVSQRLQIKILKPVAISTKSLKNGRVNRAYNARLAASGGQAPYSWSLLSGMVPEGLIFDPSSGSIKGAPTAAGSANLSFQVSDALGGISQRSVTLTIK